MKDEVTLEQALELLMEDQPVHVELTTNQLGHNFRLEEL